MLFTLTLALSVASLLLGLAWRAWGWLGGNLGQPGPKPLARLAALARALTPRGLARLAAAFFLDGLGQRRLLRENKWRWLAHQALFWGFVLLVLFHALEQHISQALFSNYYSTLNPFPPLRDLMGLLVLAGLVFLAWRRLTAPIFRKVGSWSDWAILVLLGIIIVSGFGLKAVKIVSQPRFNEMVAEYGGLEPGPRMTALEAFWQREYGVVFAGPPRPQDPQTLAQGRELHQSSCVDCHSRPSWALGSWTLSRLWAPAGSLLNRVRADHLLWQVHFLACFLALALLPFGKLLHIFTSPLSLMMDGLLGPSPPGDPPPDQAGARAARRALALDACTHCAICSQHCSVEAASQVMANELALPSLKLAALADLEHASTQKLARLRQGADLCTRCQRCTRLCPVGIDLQEVWSALDQELDQRGMASCRAQARAALVDHGLANGGALPGALEVAGAAPAQGVLDLALRRRYFRYCFQCQTCSNVCPVVASYEHPGQALGLLPHQIMYSLELGLVDQALAASMTWECATCYQCQQHCPQGVPVADLLYELRNQGHWLRCQAAGEGMLR